jgi:outer membrane protein assembly factor BamB
MVRNYPMQRQSAPLLHRPAAVRALLVICLLGGCGPPRGKVAWQIKGGENFVAPALLRDNLLIVPSSSDSLQALEPGSGKSVWRRRILGGADLAPTVWDNYLLVAGNTGTVHLLDRATGKEFWQYNTGEPPQGAPVAAQGNVYVVTRTRLWCLAAHNGRPVWARRVDRPRRMEPLFAPDGRLFLGTWDRLLVFDAAAGRLQRQIRLSHESVAAPLLWEDRLVNLAGNGLLQVFPLATLRPAWQLSLRGPAVLPMHLDRGTLYVGSGGDLQAIAAGRALWQFRRDASLRAPLVTDPRHLFAASSREGVLALDKGTGDLLWRAELAEGTSGVRLATADGVLYISYKMERPTGGVMALDVETGRAIWHRTCDGGVQMPVVALERLAFFGTLAGEYLAVRPG